MMIEVNGFMSRIAVPVIRKVYFPFSRQDCETVLSGRDDIVGRQSLSAFLPRSFTLICGCGAAPKKIASITNLMGWHIADILLPARIKQLKEKILIIR